MMMDILRGVLGAAVLLGACWAASSRRSAIDWRLVAGGTLCQAAFAALVLVVPGAQWIFQQAAAFFIVVTDFTNEGTAFLFGPLADKAKVGGAFAGQGFVFALHVLPTIIFFSALTSLLYYFGILQRVVWAFAWVMKRVMRLSGAESLAAAGEIFLGQTESPLLIKPYLARMTRSEIMALMTGGLATIAGGVMAAYVGMVGGEDRAAQQAVAQSLLCASIMNAPAALVVAKMLVPETEPVDETLEVPRGQIGSNFLDALAQGTSEGLRLAVNVGAMLLAFTAFVAMINAGLSAVSGGALSLDRLFGWAFAPVAWLIGTPQPDLMAMGSMLGKKLALNEFFAYSDLGTLRAAGALQPKSVFLASFALCGFANFASLGIQLGGTGGIAPNQRPVIAALGLRALFGGTVATLLSACWAGVFYSFIGR